MVMNTFNYETDGNQYNCRINEELSGVEILSYKGTSARLVLPEKVSDNGQTWEVKGIGKKAFIGCAGLRSVLLPKTVRRIDDWAFSQCRQLEGISVGAVFPEGTQENMMSGKDRECSGVRVDFGTGVFADCPNISYVALGATETDDLSVLLGAVIQKLPSEDLLRDSEVGTGHWYHKWDLKLQSFLNEDDEEGYTDIVLCGEEDIIKSVPEFAATKRRRKAALCMLRLMHDCKLSESVRKTYTEFLLSHTKGCETEDAWDEIVLEHGEDLNYYQFLADIGGVTECNIDDMIQALDALHAEAKAFLIRYKQEHFSAGDVFDMFHL